MSVNGALGLGITLWVADEASQGLDRIVDKFRMMDGVSTASMAKLEASVKSFKMSVGVLGAGAAVLGGAFALAGPAGKFEQSLADLQSISGATAAQLGQLHDKAIEAGIATQFDPTQAVNALRELSAQGYNAADAMKLLDPALNLAAASLGELGVAEAAQLSAQMLKAFGIEAADAAKSVDKLLQASNLFALSPKDLPLALGIGSRGAQLMHQSLDETLISLGLVKNIIPTVERASTAVAVAMEHLAAPQKKQAAEIAALGLKVTDAKGNFLPFLDVIQSLTVKLNGLSQSEQAMKLQRIFGAEALGGVQAIMTQIKNGIPGLNGEILKGGEAIKFLREQTEHADGTAKKFADRRLDTFQGQIDQLRGTMDTLAIVIGEPFARVLKPVVEGVKEFVNKIILVVKTIPDGTKDSIVKLIAGLGGILLAIGGLLAAKAAIAALGVVLSVVGGAIAAAALAMAPLIAAVGLGILMFKAFQVNAEQSGTSVFAIFSKLGLLFQGMIQLFSSGKFSGSVAEEMEKAENSGIEAFAIKVYVWIGRIGSFLDGLADGFREKIRELEPVFDDFKDALDTVASAFGLTVGSAEDNKDAFDSAGASGKSLGKTLGSIAGVITEDLTAGLYGLLLAVAAVRDGWEAMAGPIIATLDMMIGGIKSFVSLAKGDLRGAQLGALQSSHGSSELDAIKIESGMGLSKEAKAKLKAQRDADYAASIEGAMSSETSDKIGRALKAGFGAAVGQPMDFRAISGIDDKSGVAEKARLIQTEQTALPKEGLDLAIENLSGLMERSKARRANRDAAARGEFLDQDVYKKVTEEQGPMSSAQYEEMLEAQRNPARAAAQGAQAQSAASSKIADKMAPGAAGSADIHIHNHHRIELDAEVIHSSESRQRVSQKARTFGAPLGSEG